MTAVALDTNILLRLVQAESPEHGVCQKGLGKRAHDARIASTLEANGVRHLLTLNIQDFAGFANLVAAHPGSPLPF